MTVDVGLWRMSTYMDRPRPYAAYTLGKVRNYRTPGRIEGHHVPSIEAVNKHRLALENLRALGVVLIPVVDPDALQQVRDRVRYILKEAGLAGLYRTQLVEDGHLLRVVLR